MNCPACDGEGQLKLLGEWNFAQFKVKRYECNNCKERFNSYEQNGNVKFTIPRYA